MFPESEYQPSSISEKRRDLSVTLPIASELRLPVVGIGFGVSGMFGAPVPETAVDEDRDAPTSEHDVRTRADVLFDLGVYLISQAGCMDQSTNSQFRFRVPTLVGEHATPCALGRSP